MNPTVAWATLHALQLASNGSNLTIRAMVDDGFGGTDTAETSLVISNLPPSPNAGGPYTIDYGSALTLAGSATDVGGDAVVSCAWDIDGDGQYDDGVGTAPAVQWFMLRGLGAGTHTIRLQAQDADGATATATASLTIAASTNVAGYVTGDWHQHTTFTDGSYSFGYQMARSKQFGLDWWANSEHGGGGNRDGRVSGIGADPLGTNVTWAQAGIVPLGNNLTGGNMWRWQSIRDYSFPALTNARAMYSDRVIIQGYEWNVPGTAPAGATGSGHEHCSMGSISGQFGASPNANAIAQFEYQFDMNDADTTGDNGAGWSKSSFANTDDAKMVQAAQWLQAYHATKSWLTPAHPERKKCWNVQTFRKLNDAAPSVAFGFESMPGHQRSSNRGEYSASSAGGGTYGGCGVYAAKVGGLWDAMLGEGRKFWLFTSSDSHEVAANDFYPGEYQKTYTYVTDRTDAQAIADGLRSGNSWVVEGDLIDGLEFTVDGVAMGGTRTLAPASVTATIRVHDPAGQNWGPAGHNTPALDHLDVIAGEYGNKIATNSPAYTNDVNATAQVIARFGAAAAGADANGIATTVWTDEGNGWKSMTLTVNLDGKKKYLRLRGSNQPVGGTETDAAGNPLLDTPGVNTALKAWDDLWFYSNPIFVDPTMVSLTVTSARGTPSPAVGTNTYAAGSPVSASVEAVVATDTTKYVCQGWTGTGDVPASGTSNAVAFTLTSASTLDWNWQTQHLLDTGVRGGGSVDVADGWLNAGTVVTITATPAAGCVFTGWTGDVVTNSNPLVLTMGRAYAVTALMPPTNAFVAIGYSATNAAGHTFGVNAFTSIQAAVDAVKAGGTVLVEDGVYSAGSASVSGMPARVALTKGVTLRSVNGPAGAVIEGTADPAINGPAAVRCAYVSYGSSLIGFTLRGGHTKAAGSEWQINGGGAFVEAGGLVDHCIVEDSSAFVSGGGVYLKGAATLRNCLVTDNAAGSYGGGVFVWNGGTVESCTLSANSSALGVGGLYAYRGTVRNSILWGNNGLMEYYTIESAFERNCSKYVPAGSDNLVADPQFVSPAYGNYALAGASPCIDAGTDQSWMTAEKDLAGEDRVRDGNADATNKVDIGAFEAGPAPRMDILANGYGADLSVSSAQTVQVAITANPGHDGASKDWWILVEFGGNWLHFDLTRGWVPGIQATLQSPLLPLPTIPLLEGRLPVGTYTFYFAVDGTPDGRLDLGSLVVSGVKVTVH